MEQNKRRKKKNRILKNNQFLSIVLIACAMMQILYHALLSGMIGDMGMGYYGITINWILLMMSVASMSIPYIISHLISSRIMRNQTKNALKMFQLVAAVVIVISFTLMIISMIMAEPIAYFILHEPLVSFGIRVAMPLFLLYSIIQVLKGYFQSFGTDMPTGVAMIVEQFFMLVASLLVSSSMYGKGQKIAVFLHNENYAPLYGAVGAIIGMYIGTVISLLFLLILFIQHYKSLQRQSQKDTTIRLEGIAALGRSFAFSYMPAMIICFVMFLSKTIDLIIFRKTMEDRGTLLEATKQWGLYTTKYQVVLLLPLACIMAVASLYVKAIASAYMKKDSSDMKKRLLGLIRRSVRVFFFFSAVYTVLAKPIIKMLFKGDALTATTLLRTGGLMPFCMALTFLTAYILYETGYVNMVLLTTCITSIIQVIVFVLCLQVGKMHIQGIVIADVLSMLICAIANLMLLQKMLRYRQEYVRTFAIPLAAVMISSITMVLIQLLLANMPAFISFFICTIIGGIIYIVCLIVLKVLGEEELYDFPFGDIVVSLARACRLL